MFCPRGYRAWLTVACPSARLFDAWRTCAGCGGGALRATRYKLNFLKGLKDAPDKPILAIVINKYMSALDRNIHMGLEMLDEADQAKCHIYNHGLVFNEGMVSRELLRCARDGMSVEDTLKRLEWIVPKCHMCCFMCSESVVKVAKSGRVPELGDGSQIEPGQQFVFGTVPPNPDPATYNDMMKAKRMLNLLETHPAGPGVEAAAQLSFIKTLKAGLAPNEVVRDVIIYSLGRIDFANNFAQLLRENVKLLPGDRITVLMAPAIMAAFMSWGEIMMTYWVDELPAGEKKSAVL